MSSVLTPHACGTRQRTFESSPLPNHPSSSHPQSSNKLFPFAFMSRSHLTASGSSSSNFQLIFNNALEAYEKRTKKHLLDHPLAPQLQACDFPEEILAILHQQIEGLDQSHRADERWIKWLDPTVHVLRTFSLTAGTVGLVSHVFIRDLQSHVNLAVILTRNGGLCGYGCSPFSVYPR